MKTINATINNGRSCSCICQNGRLGWHAFRGAASMSSQHYSDMPAAAPKARHRAAHYVVSRRSTALATMSARTKILYIHAAMPSDEAAADQKISL